MLNCLMRNRVLKKPIPTTLAGHAGANLVYEAAGMQGSLLGFSLEGLVIDNDYARRGTTYHTWYRDQ